jgi:hypothetical protein
MHCEYINNTLTILAVLVGALSVQALPSHLLVQFVELQQLLSVIQVAAFAGLTDQQ